MDGRSQVVIAPMQLEDVERVFEIDQISFPLPWSAAAYRYELAQNKNAHFFVALTTPPSARADGVSPARQRGVLRSSLSALLRGADKLRSADKQRSTPTERDLQVLPSTATAVGSANAGPSGGRSVVGYAGFWYIVDEAHISTIAVHPEWRGRGVGQHLLAGILTRALDLGAISATLEVRVGNDSAQNLYRKYGFEPVGRRRRYYRDNGEDAVLMTVALPAAYREQLERLESHKSQRTR